MSTPRWTLRPDRVLLRDGQPIGQLSLVPHALAKRIVSLLNATELTPDAIVMLQHACMNTVAQDCELAELAPVEGSDVARERNERIGTLNMLTVMLNHTKRMYVELDEEETMKLEPLEGGPR